MLPIHYAALFNTTPTLFRILLEHCPSAASVRVNEFHADYHMCLPFHLLCTNCGDISQSLPLLGRSYPAATAVRFPPLPRVHHGDFGGSGEDFLPIHAIARLHGHRLQALSCLVDLDALGAAAPTDNRQTVRTPPARSKTTPKPLFKLLPIFETSLIVFWSCA